MAPKKPNTLYIKPTTEIKFNDVKETDWFYGDVMSAVDMGLINGKNIGVYAPNDNLTYAEAAKLAACMHQLYMEGVVTLKNGTANWYDTYVDYCVDNGIITKEYNYNEKATRAGYMVIFAHALPDEALKAVNNVPDNSIPDVPTSSAYSPEVYKLYRAGILQGSDEIHSCKPYDNIKRSEVAAILSRMMDETKRVKFSMGEEEQVPEETKPEENREPEKENSETENAQPKAPEIKYVKDLAGQNITIRGYGENQSDISNYLHSISSLPYISRLDVVAIEEHKIEDGIYNIFEITVTGVGYNENQIQG